jgi:hypothetical protein
VCFEIAREGSRQEQASINTAQVFVLDPVSEMPVLEPTSCGFGLEEQMS